jgi:hypothetical protein
MARFERGTVLASLNHPNIAAIYGIEETNGQTNQVGLVIELAKDQRWRSNYVLVPSPDEHFQSPNK